MNRSLAIFVLLLTAAASCPAAPLPEPGVYRMDPAQSELLVRTDRAGLFAFAGHRHVIQADVFEGQVTLGPDGNPAALRIAIESASLAVRDQDLSESDVAKVQRDMEQKVLEVATHPYIAFRSFVIETRKDDYRVRGVLEIRGVSREVDFPMTVVPFGDLLQLAGTAEVSQRDFGIPPVSAGLGTVKVKNEILVEFRIEARRSAPQAPVGN